MSRGGTLILLALVFVYILAICALGAHESERIDALTRQVAQLQQLAHDHNDSDEVVTFNELTEDCDD